MSDESRILLLSDLFQRQELSPVEVAQSQLEAIAERDQGINSFCYLDEEATIRMARDSETRHRNGRALGPLDGVPISVKDTVNVSGWPTRRGSLTSSAEPVAADAISVRRLREAGAVLVGKTTTPEFAWKGVTDSPLCGVTRNPLDRSLTAGGSSGGASAAVALGIGVMAIGTDAAGSVRIPSAFCGTVGFKPSFGRIPLDPFPTGFFQLPHIGPITATVADAAISTTIMAGPSASDWTSLRHGEFSAMLSDIEADLPELRIGVMGAENLAHLAPDVAAGWSDFRATLEAQGHGTIEIDLPFSQARDVAGLFYRIGCMEAVRQVAEDHLDRLDPGLLEFIAPVHDLTSDGLISLCRSREQIANRAAAALVSEADVIITPAMGVMAPTIAELERPGQAARWLDWNLFTPMFNVAHGPAISVPWPSPSGLPIGIQVAAAPGRDLAALRVARRIERLSGYRPASLAMRT